MKTIEKYTLAFSSCPNDTFIFKAMVKNFIDCQDMKFDVRLEDVETLNQMASRSMFDITKLSFAAFGSLSDQYGLLRSGSALGKGCGPLIISHPGKMLSDSKKPKIAVPGMGTTAFHLFKFYIDDLFKGLEPDIIPMPFEKIMPDVIEGRADFGVIIHEGRFVYQNFNLEMTADLGQWWEDTTSLPIPLGCIAIKRDIDPQTALSIERLIKKSIEHAFSNPEAGLDFIKEHAQELDDEVIDQHIGLYVNEFSKDIGPLGEEAIAAFFEKAAAAKLIKKINMPLFAC